MILYLVFFRFSLGKRFHSFKVTRLSVNLNYIVLLLNGTLSIQKISETGKEMYHHSWILLLKLTNVSTSFYYLKLSMMHSFDSHLPLFAKDDKLLILGYEWDTTRPKTDNSRI